MCVLYFLSRRRGKYTTQTGYMNPYYLSKAYITNLSYCNTMGPYYLCKAQALVSGNFFLPRYYIYYKVRNRTFVKNLGHRDFRVFSTRRTPAWRNGLHHLKLR